MSTNKKQKNTSNGKNKKTNMFGVFSELGQLLLIIVLILVAVSSFGTRIPFLASRGFNFFAVTSGSMEPEIPVGSMIKVGKYSLENLKEGDVITYQVGGTEEDPDTQAIVTHRIFKIDKNEEVRILGEGEDAEEKTVVEYEIITKGDANPVEDSYKVKSNNIIGLYEWQIPKIGYITHFAQTSTGFILLVIVPAIVLIAWEVVSLILHFKTKSSVKNKAEINSLKEELAKEKNKNKKNDN